MSVSVAQDSKRSLAMTRPSIQLTKIYKTYVSGDLETPVLMDVSLAIQAGEYVAIMGPSGSGKSTMMHILGALDKATSGTYLLDGDDIQKLGDDELAEIRNKKIGFVFQAFNLLARTSALENVKLPMDYADVPDEEQESRARALLELVDLTDRMDHTPSKLSGGQQQRVALARALVMEPTILLADEPTGNIASVQAEEVMEIFQKLNDQGHTIVMITHEPDIAAHAKRIIHIRDGRIVGDEKNQRRTVIRRKK
jgi:putative ABC transport system ATP-binding protein